jgi:hypothetical protein
MNIPFLLVYFHSYLVVVISDGNHFLHGTETVTDPLGNLTWSQIVVIFMGSFDAKVRRNLMYLFDVPFVQNPPESIRHAR